MSWLLNNESWKVSPFKKSQIFKQFFFLEGKEYALYPLENSHFFWGRNFLSILMMSVVQVWDVGNV